MFVGRIYKIWAPGVERCYVGSTRHLLNIRLARHKANMRAWLRGRRSWCSSNQILEHEQAQIELLEENEFGDEREMLEREKYWIGRLPTVNRRNPTQNVAEKAQQMADKDRRRLQVREPCPVCGRVMAKMNHKRHMRRMHPSSPAQI